MMTSSPEWHVKKPINFLTRLIGANMKHGKLKKMRHSKFRKRTFQDVRYSLTTVRHTVVARKLIVKAMSIPVMTVKDDWWNMPTK